MEGYTSEFLKIDWNRPVSGEQMQKFCRDYDEFETDSYIFQMLHDQLKECPVYMEEELDPQLHKDPPMYVPGYNKNLRLPTSQFSGKEMGKLFGHFLAIKKGLPGNLDKTYIDAVREEQNKYITLASDMWTRFNYKRAFYVDKSVETYMRELWLRKVQAVQQFYPETYRHTSTLHFVCKSIDADYSVHINRHFLLETKHRPRLIKMPKYGIRLALPTSVEELKSKKNPMWCLTKKPVSADKTAFKWAKLYKPDVVLTASALKALANNFSPHYMTEWNLIVTVKDIDVDGVKKKVVFIDKPLPSCSLTNMQNIQWHAKLACKMFLKRKEQTFTEPKKSAEDVRKVSVYDDDEWLKSSSDGESFGICSDFQSPSLSNLIENEDCHTEDRSGTSSQISSSTNLESSSKKDNMENSQLPNYSYSFWHLSSLTNKLEETQKILRKGDMNLRPLSLIIRNKIDGIVNFCGPKSFGVISSKVEYQEDLGAEIMSPTELINEWLDLMIRPNSSLIRARVSYKGEYIMFEKKNISDVEAEALRLYKFILKSTLKTLQVLLCQLCNLHTGQYYVTHSSNYGAFAHVYTSVPPTTQHVFNLHEFCKKNWNKGITKEQHVPWKPLDMAVFTPTHFHLKCIPGTFRIHNSKHSAFQQHAALRAISTANREKKRIMKSQKRSAKKKRKLLAEKLKKVINEEKEEDIKEEEEDKLNCDSSTTCEYIK